MNDIWDCGRRNRIISIKTNLEEAIRISFDAVTLIQLLYPYRWNKIVKN